MGASQLVRRVVSMVAATALVASGLAAVSVASGAGAAQAAAAAAPGAAAATPTAVSLEADRTVFAAGERVTLTAIPNEDVTVSSSYRVVVKDLTTGGVLGYCGKSSSVAVWSAAGGTCTVTTSFATGGPHTYKAYVAADTALNDTQATSNEVVVERAAWTVALAADKTTFTAGEKVTLTATPNQDVTSSSYRVVLKDVTTGAVLGHCGSSSQYATWSAADGTCTVTTSFATGEPHAYQAYVAVDNTLGELQASSNTVEAARAAWTVALATDKTTFTAGEKVTLTATPNQDVTSSSYRVVLKDVTTGGVLGHCGSSSQYATWSAADGTCTVTTSFATGEPHTYRAYAAVDSALGDLQATSNEVVLQRMAWSVAVTSDSSEFAVGEKSTLTVAVNQDVKVSSYQIVIKDVTTGSTIGYCRSGNDSGATWSAVAKTCTVQVSFPTVDRIRTGHM